MSQGKFKPIYKRVLLKLSGEALMGDAEFGIDPKIIDRVAGEIKELVDFGVQVAVVVGGGNIFRVSASPRAGWNGQQVITWAC